MHTLRGTICQLQYTSCLLPLKRVADTQQQSRLLHIVVLVAQYANATGLHHQTEREGEIISQPSLGERSGRVAMCDQDDVLGFAVVHMRCLDFANLLDQFVEARRKFCWRSGRILADNRGVLVTAEAILLSALTSVSPNVPFLILIKTALFAKGSDVFGDAAFVVTTSTSQLYYTFRANEQEMVYP